MTCEFNCSSCCCEASWGPCGSTVLSTVLLSASCCALLITAWDCVPKTTTKMIKIPTRLATISKNESCPISKPFPRFRRLIVPSAHRFRCPNRSSVFAVGDTVHLLPASRPLPIAVAIDHRAKRHPIVRCGHARRWQTPMWRDPCFRRTSQTFPSRRLSAKAAGPCGRDNIERGSFVRLNFHAKARRFWVAPNQRPDAVQFLAWPIGSASWAVLAQNVADCRYQIVMTTTSRRAWARLQRNRLVILALDCLSASALAGRLRRRKDFAVRIQMRYFPWARWGSKIGSFARLRKRLNRSRPLATPLANPGAGLRNRS